MNLVLFRFISIRIRYFRAYLGDIMNKSVDICSGDSNYEDGGGARRS